MKFVKGEFMGRLEKYAIAAVLVAISSQFYIDILVENFRVSCGIITLGIVMYLYKELNSILIGAVSGISVYLWRIFILFMRSRLTAELSMSYFIEISFYILIGVLVSIYFKKQREVKIHHFAIWLTVFDFTSNFFEITLRVVFLHSQFYFDIFLVLFLTACIRGLAVYMIITFVNYYKRMLKDAEHEERYKKLLWVNSLLESEMYWMNKNMDKIEEVMGRSYELYGEMRTDPNGDKYSSRMIDITKDIHELKKDHQLVLRGIEDIIENKYKDSGMHFKDIVNLLQDKIKLEIAYREMNVDFTFEKNLDFYTSKHFHLMSVFRNLFMNALESMEKSGGNTLICRNRSENDCYVFEITDTGEGISKKDLNNIFNAGFSTKIDYETGIINRGLGLSVVKYMIEEHFGGSISVESEIDKGTTFKVTVNKAYMGD